MTAPLARRHIPELLSVALTVVKTTKWKRSQTAACVLSCVWASGWDGIKEELDPPRGGPWQRWRTVRSRRRRERRWTDLLVVRLQALYDARDAEVVVGLGAVQRPGR